MIPKRVFSLRRSLKNGPLTAKQWSSDPVSPFYLPGIRLRLLRPDSLKPARLENPRLDRTFPQNYLEHTDVLVSRGDTWQTMPHNVPNNRAPLTRSHSRVHGRTASSTSHQEVRRPSHLLIFCPIVLWPRGFALSHPRSNSFHACCGVYGASGNRVTFLIPFARVGPLNGRVRSVAIIETAAGYGCFTWNPDDIEERRATLIGGCHL